MDCDSITQTTCRGGLGHVSPHIFYSGNADAFQARMLQENMSSVKDVVVVLVRVYWTFPPSSSSCTARVEMQQALQDAWIKYLKKL